jgi:hypothetical protein
MRLRITLDSGKFFEIEPNDKLKTFEKLLTEIFKERYYVLFGNNENKGNVCLDTYKISYIEII